jgi:type I restriction enzyme, S subunit
MNAERLLEVYEQISEAPDAIARLRRFVLDLAVRGKLVEQDPTDEPASTLLDCMTAERAELERSKAIKKVKLSVFNASNDTIPFNWIWTQLGTVGDWGAGSTPQRGNSEFYGGDIPWLKSGELGDSLRLKGSEETVTHKALAKCSFRLNKPGDVLIAMYGATIGKLAILAEDAVTNQAVCGCTPFEGLANRYLFLFLLASREAFHASSEGGAQPNISKVKIVNTRFPLPPLAEQHRIVAKVDELMALCDRLEEARKTREEVRDKLTAASLARLTAPDTTAEDFPTHAAFALEALPALTTRPDQIKTLRQTILDLAVRGKLVEQDPADEPASTALSRLKVAAPLAFRDEGLRARKPVAPASRQNLKFDFPEHWELPIFNDVFVMVSGVTKGGKVSPQDAQVRPYLRVANVQRGKLDLGIIKTIEVKTADAERYRLKDGDILMTEGGDWDKLGRAAIWRCQIDDCIHQNHVFRVRPPSDDILPEWVITYVNSELGRSFFEDASKQTTNLASINMTQLRGCPLPLPPLAEQHRIVAKVDALMALCDRLEAALTTTDTTRTRLLESLLHEALEPAATALEAAE